MRTATRTIGVMFALLFGASASAAGQGPIPSQSRTVTCVVTAVVSSFVRLVSLPGDPTTGAPPRVSVVTNDPRIRAAMAQPLTPEIIGPAEMVYTTEGAGHGGESAIRGRFEVGVPTVRYTIATP